MIYRNDFVWLHFPKNAGTKIEKIFQKYIRDESIMQDDLSLKDGHWHDSIIKRMDKDQNFNVNSKKIIVCVRRLESWLISRYNFEVKRSPNLSHDPNMLLTGNFLEQSGYINHADHYISTFLPNLKDDFDKYLFIKIEEFEADFKNVFSEFVDISLIPEKEYLSKENHSTNKISQVFLSKLKDNIHGVYKACPLWAEMEDLVYGGH